MSKIFRVDRVTAFRMPTPVKLWLVLARGVCRTSGWSNPRLVPDGKGDYLSLNFEADAPKPADVLVEVLTPIGAAGVFNAATHHRGVEVIAETNRKIHAARFLTASESGDVDADFMPYEDEVPGFDSEDDIAERDSAFGSEAIDVATKCERKTLLKIPLYPEVKFKGWKCYKRWRYSITELEWCYPSNLGDEAEKAIRKCLPPAIAAGVAAFAVGGAGLAVKAFTDTLVGCVGGVLGSKVSVRVRVREHKGNWSRC